jgi:hypothetical protein
LIREIIALEIAAELFISRHWHLHKPTFMKLSQAKAKEVCSGVGQQSEKHSKSPARQLPFRGRRKSLEERNLTQTRSIFELFLVFARFSFAIDSVRVSIEAQSCSALL